MRRRVGGAERGEKWAKRRENGFLLLVACCCCCSSVGDGGLRRTGAPRVCDVAFMCSVPIDLYVNGGGAQESAATDNITRLLFSRYIAQQRLAHQHVPHTRSHRPWNHRPCRARNRHSGAQTRCAFFAFPFTYHSANVPLAAQITILSKIPPNNSKLTCELCFGIISKWALY